MTSDFLKNYDASEETLRRLYDSRLRLAILDALKDKPMRLADLRRAIKANAPNTSTKAKDLERMGALERADGDFKLTPFGQAARLKAKETFEFYSAYEKFKEYWLSRRLDFIPKDLWQEIGLLRNSEVVKSAQLNTIFTHDNFVKLLGSADKSFRGISPIYHDDYLSAIKRMVAKGVDIELIFTLAVAQQVVKSLSKAEAKALAAYPRIKLYVCEGIDSGISISSSFMVLCLVSKTDIISLMDQYLYSKGPDGVAWGAKLFDYYKRQSKPVRISDYL